MNNCLGIIVWSISRLLDCRRSVQWLGFATTCFNLRSFWVLWDSIPCACIVDTYGAVLPISVGATAFCITKLLNGKQVVTCCIRLETCTRAVHRLTRQCRHCRKNMRSYVLERTYCAVFGSEWICHLYTPISLSSHTHETAKEFCFIDFPTPSIRK